MKHEYQNRRSVSIQPIGKRRPDWLSFLDDAYKVVPLVSVDRAVSLQTIVIIQLMNRDDVVVLEDFMNSSPIMRKVTHLVVSCSTSQFQEEHLVRFVGKFCARTMVRIDYVNFGRLWWPVDFPDRDLLAELHLEELLIRELGYTEMHWRRYAEVCQELQGHSQELLALCKRMKRKYVSQHNLEWAAGVRDTEMLLGEIASSLSS